jgi:hypothetical protein
MAVSINSTVLWFATPYSSKKSQTFRRNISPPSSGSKCNPSKKPSETDPCFYSSMYLCAWRRKEGFRLNCDNWIRSWSIENLDSSVSIMTTLLLDDRWMIVRFPARASHSQNPHSLAPSGYLSCTWGTWSRSLVPSVKEVENAWSSTSTPHTPSWLGA